MIRVKPQLERQAAQISVTQSSHKNTSEPSAYNFSSSPLEVYLWPGETKWTNILPVFICALSDLTAGKNFEGNCVCVWVGCCLFVFYFYYEIYEYAVLPKLCLCMFPLPEAVRIRKLLLKNHERKAFFIFHQVSLAHSQIFHLQD